jgi:two-component system response regulator FixJ
MPEMDGLTLQREINRTIPGLPVVIMTGHGDIPMAVQAMKDGAIEFLEKPFDKETLLNALKIAFDRPKQVAQASAATEPRRALTEREQEVFNLLVDGHQNKVVAHKLGISTRTVEVHRGRVMEKLNAKNLADLVRFSIAKRGA